MERRRFLPGARRRRLRLALAAALVAGLLGSATAPADLAAGERAARAGDFKTALAQLKAAARGGDARAQTRLADMYRRGLGTARDLAAARRWYTRAAEQGDAPAQFKLGVLYRQGLGVARDDVQAGQWFRKAALLGYIPAQLNLGVLYVAGAGVPRDLVEGYAWLHRAAEAGNASAIRNRTALAEHMSPADIARAEKRAGELF